MIRREGATRVSGSVWDLDFWIDDKQTYLLNANDTNNEIHTIVRETGAVVGAFRRNGRNAGEFHWAHNLAVDSKGNIYTTEVDIGKRVQNFRYVGPTPRQRIRPPSCAVARSNDVVIHGND
jgi:hypothetical protein